MSKSPKLGDSAKIYNRNKKINFLNKRHKCMTMWYNIIRGVISLTTISVRLNEQEAKIFEEYAKLNGVALSTLFKKTLEEKMELDFDLKAIQEYENEKSDETYSHEDLKKTLGL